MIFFFLKKKQDLNSIIPQCNLFAKVLKISLSALTLIEWSHHKHNTSSCSTCELDLKLFWKLYFIQIQAVSVLPRGSTVGASSHTKSFVVQSIYLHTQEMHSQHPEVNWAFNKFLYFLIIWIPIPVCLHLIQLVNWFKKSYPLFNV